MDYNQEFSVPNTKNFQILSPWRKLAPSYGMQKFETEFSRISDLSSHAATCDSSFREGCTDWQQNLIQSDCTQLASSSQLNHGYLSNHSSEPNMQSFHSRSAGWKQNESYMNLMAFTESMAARRTPISFTGSVAAARAPISSPSTFTQMLGVEEMSASSSSQLLLNGMVPLQFNLSNCGGLQNTVQDESAYKENLEETAQWNATMPEQVRQFFPTPAAGSSSVSRTIMSPYSLTPQCREKFNLNEHVHLPCQFINLIDENADEANIQNKITEQKQISLEEQVELFFSRPIGQCSLESGVPSSGSVMPPKEVLPQQLHNIEKPITSSEKDNADLLNIEESSNQECDGIDLNKTPNQKSRRKKHRPKVIREGKPTRTPKPKTPKPLTPKVTRNIDPLTGKRKYVRKKNIQESPQSCSNVPDGISSENTQSRTKSAKRHLNFDLETPEPRDRMQDQTVVLQEQGTCHASKSQIAEPSCSLITKPAVRLDQKREVVDYNSGSRVTFNVFSSVNHKSFENFKLAEDTEDATQNCTAAVLYSHVQNACQTKSGEQTTSQASRSTLMCQSSITLGKNIDYITYASDDRGSLESDQMETRNSLIKGTKRNNMHDYHVQVHPDQFESTVAVEGYLFNIFKKQRSLPEQDWFEPTVDSSLSHMSKVSCRNEERVAEMSELLRFTDIQRSQLLELQQESEGIMDFDQIKNSTHFSPELLNKSLWQINVNNKTTPVSKLNLADLGHHIPSTHANRPEPANMALHIPSTPLKLCEDNSSQDRQIGETQTCTNTQVGSRSIKPITKGRKSKNQALQVHSTCPKTKRGRNGGRKDAPCNIGNGIVEKTSKENNHDLESARGISVYSHTSSIDVCQNSYSMPERNVDKLLSKAMLPFDDPVDQIILKLRDLNIKEDRIIENCDVQNALVPYEGGGIMVAYQPKKKRPRPKVDLDPETERVWRLLMGKEYNDGVDDINNDKEKWWEEERRIFHGRVDSFIARMHLVQGDRRFSKWKGSVVDSVVGVFLTQNVSDHLSSSAYMALAAKFPAKATDNSDTTVGEMASSMEEERCIVELVDESSKFEGQRLGKRLDDQDPPLNIKETESAKSPPEARDKADTIVSKMASSSGQGQCIINLVSESSKCEDQISGKKFDDRHPPMNIRETESAYSNESYGSNTGCREATGFKYFDTNETVQEVGLGSPDSRTSVQTTVTGSASPGEVANRCLVEDVLSSQNSVASSRINSIQSPNYCELGTMNSDRQFREFLTGSVSKNKNPASFTELLRIAHTFPPGQGHGGNICFASTNSEIGISNPDEYGAPSATNSFIHTYANVNREKHIQGGPFADTSLPSNFYDFSSAGVTGLKNVSEPGKGNTYDQSSISSKINSFKTSRMMDILSQPSTDRVNKDISTGKLGSFHSSNASACDVYSQTKNHSVDPLTTSQNSAGNGRKLYLNDNILSGINDLSRDLQWEDQYQHPANVKLVNLGETQKSQLRVSNGVELNLNDEAQSSKMISPDTRKAISKEKKTKADNESKKTFDWDSLRKEVEKISGKMERSHDRMDSIDWNAIRSADVSEISETIRERGMNNMLAERIKNFLNRIVRDHGSIDLEWLRDVEPDKAKDYLLSIRGLGLKSVECVRLLTLHHLAFPVDTNVGRICVRLGWVPLQPLPESLQLHLLELYPILETIQKYIWPRLCKLDQRTLYELHYQMITFGKVFCTKSKPNCNACPMRGECRHFASAFASARLALPGPEEKSIVSSAVPVSLESNHVVDLNPILSLPFERSKDACEPYRADKCEPVIQEPASPEPEHADTEESAIEDAFYEDPDEIPVIKIDFEEFTQNLQNYMQANNMEIQEADVSKALVALNQDSAYIPTPKLKNVSRLRTEHYVYELPDSHPLLEGFDHREPDDPSSYLLAIWAPGETAQSIGLPEESCNYQETGQLCSRLTCFTCNGIREAQAQTVRGTLLIPCRTAMRGSFPLNGTYFQVNEVFADHETSRNPIDVPRELIWNLPRRTVYFGTSVPSIFKGLTTEQIQQCFWRGFVCVRGFDRKTRAPRPLYARLHFPASKVTKNRKPAPTEAKATE